MRKFIEPLAWLVSISLIVYAVYWAVGPSIVKPSYASEVSDKVIADMNEAAPKFPRKPLLSADVKVLLDQGHGSAFYAGNNLWLTAAHVVDGPSKRLDLKFADGSTRKATVLWISKTTDVALLQADGEGVAVSPINCGMPQVGDDITLAGNPVGLEFIRAFGRIAGEEREIGPWKSVVVVSAPTIPGQSGGAVYNSQGEVVGITVGLSLMPLGFAASTTGYGFVVPGSTICQLLARV